MPQLRLILLSVAILLSAASPFWFHHRAGAALAAAQNSEHDQAAEIARLTAENERLTQPPVPLLSQEELKELLQLRNEVGRLHTAVAETQKLRAVTTPAPPGPNHWPKDQLAYAGYATPESTLKTALWALQNSDMNAMIACMTPEVLAAMQLEKQKDAHAAEEMEKQFKDMASAVISPSTGFSLLDRTNAAPDEATLRLAFDGQDVSMDFKLKKVGDDWKIQDTGRPELRDPSR